MYTIAALCCFLGFYSLFNTSKKATLSHNYSIQIWLQHHIRLARLIGLALIIVSLFIFISLDGIEACTFGFLVLLMALASAVVILSPLKLLKWIHLLFIVAFLLVSEFLIFN